MVHGGNEKGKRACEHGAQKSVGCHGTGSIARECVYDVIKSCLKDCREAEARQGDADNRRPVIYVGRGCPCASRVR